MTRAQAFRTGFFAALGVAALMLALLAAWSVLRATLGIITPFIVAILFALLLDPVVDRVQERWTRGRRLPAVLVVYLFFLLFFVALLAFLVPSMIEQARGLAERFPVYLDQARVGINDWLRGHREVGGMPLPEDLEALVAQYSEQLSRALRLSLGHMTAIIVGSVSGLLSLVLIPIITFYLLHDIDRLRARLFFLLPPPYRDAAQRTALDVGGVFGGYVRGLLVVCFAYGVATVLLLLLLGLSRYALLLGVAAGVLYAVPYVGALLTGVLAVIVALATGGSAGYAALVAALVLALNQVFDQVVMPRVVGGQVGLHPVVALFALLLGAELFGLWGMLLAVPIAASIQVVLYRLFPRLTAPTPLVFLRAEERAQRRAAGATETVPPPPPSDL